MKHLDGGGAFRQSRTPIPINMVHKLKALSDVLLEILKSFEPHLEVIPQVSDSDQIDSCCQCHIHHSRNSAHTESISKWYYYNGL